MSEPQITPLPEPPYYAVVFTSVRTAGDNGYGETAARMAELVRDQPGFLGMDTAHEPGGIGITVGYFRDEESIRGWRQQIEHAAARKRGRAEWYESFAVHVAKVERSYAFERPAAIGEEG
ncbi:antibiotic biosynthesis monooxygenase family protein [Streptomyces sp. 8N616]|uniref:antibiotic biosynthesis monooxygenase family protein n=1 Tax=Streptomyces sp. 8N616 TaxID=3457414 RepID=UPI003FD1C811